MEPSLLHPPRRLLFSLLRRFGVLIIAVAIPTFFGYLIGFDTGTLFGAANFFLILLFVEVAIILHEIGHVVAGRMMGASVKRMVLGSGHEIHRAMFGKLKVILNTSMMSGLVIVTWPETLKIRQARKAFYVLGGILVNLALSLTFFFVFGFNDLRSPLGIVTAFIIGNAILLINIIPFKTSRYGVIMYSDGWQLLRLLFRKEEVDNQAVVESIYTGFEMIEEKKFESAEDLFSDLLEKHPSNITVRFNLAVVMLKNRDVDGSLRVALNVAKLDANRDVIRMYQSVCNLIAWLYLLEGDIETAHLYAKTAFQESKRSLVIRGTLGCILIEKGEIDEGINMLLATFDKRYANSTTLTAAAYLMYAYHVRRNYAFAEKYRAFALNHRENMDWDDEFLFNRNLRKITATKDVAPTIL